MATVTSLPELVRGLSAVPLASTPDIAVGDDLGSVVFNLALLALAEMLSRRSGLYGAADRTHVLTAAVGVLMIGIVLIALSAARSASGWAWGHVSVFSVALVAVYGLAMRALYKFEMRSSAPSPPASVGLPLRQALGGYPLAAPSFATSIRPMLRPPRSPLLGTLTWAGLSLSVPYALSAVAQSSLGP